MVRKMILWRQAEKLWVVQSGESFGEASVVAFQYLKGAYKNKGEGLFIWEDSDGTSGNGLKLK